MRQPHGLRLARRILDEALRVQPIHHAEVVALPGPAAVETVGSEQREDGVVNPRLVVRDVETLPSDEALAGPLMAPVWTLLSPGRDIGESVRGIWAEPATGYARFAPRGR